MMTHRFAVTALACLAALLWTSAAPAQDTVITRDNAKGIKGKIETETTRGVKSSGAKALIPAEKIVDVVYEVKPLEVKLKFYGPAVETDHQAIKAREGARKPLAVEAVKKYKQALEGLSAGQTFALRNVQFRIAFLTALQAEDDRKDTAAQETAIAQLTEFKSKYPTSWQIGRALKTLAELQAEQKDYAGAEQSYRELAEAPVDDAMREEAELLAATVAVRAGKYGDAEKNLTSLISKLPQTSRASERAQLALAEALAANKKLGEARTAARKVLNETKAADLKAMAYNTLGYCAFMGEQYQDARWEFLWVDVIYNQDKGEHAKALYYLWQTFEKLNDTDRARECLETLRTDAQFAGTEWQRRAERESKTE
jgi:tetratricopeptide (TPR) repeat protein